MCPTLKKLNGHFALGLSVRSKFDRSFEHGQLILENEYYLEKIKKNSYVFFNLSPFAFLRDIAFLQIWTSKTCNKYISKTITASSLRFGQLKDGGK